MYFLILFCFAGVYGADFTLPGVCPNVTLQKNFDYNRFSGVWHNVAGYASDGEHIHDCATLDLQKVDHGYTLRETYVVLEERKRTQKWYQAKVGTASDPAYYAQFMIHREIEGLDRVLDYPFMILSTDYDGYAIAYICIWLKEKERKHFVFAWILTRSKEKLHGKTLKQVEEELSKYPELAEHRQEFVFKEFDNATCAFEHKVETDFFNSYFC
ncbi:unnamed protein product [Arctia plantaginis]|uniref:Lipocalin/cytosolic fatty-acid binding domain-containing protein n=1 Tax=Arctia plantaginis TaxID=874455 RepID=A0A8S1AUG1_ARCPL|nr:unnamed protein product [Arctia plantaginis]